jgi:hypothetical protein
MSGPKNWATFAPKRLRILSEDNTERAVQHCIPLRAKLTVSACALRWAKADKPHSAGDYLETPYGTCKGCVIGRRNYVEESARRRESESVEVEESEAETVEAR